MKKYQHGYSHVLIVIIIIVALIGTLGYLFWKNATKENDQQSSATTVAKNQTDANETVDLPTFIGTIDSATFTQSSNEHIKEYTFVYDVPSGWAKQVQYDDEFIAEESISLTSPSENVVVILTAMEGVSGTSQCSGMPEYGKIIGFNTSYDSSSPGEGNYAEFISRKPNGEYGYYAGLTAKTDVTGIKQGAEVCSNGVLGAIGKSCFWKVTTRDANNFQKEHQCYGAEIRLKKYQTAVNSSPENGNAPSAKVLRDLMVTDEFNIARRVVTSIKLASPTEPGVTYQDTD